jgi:hypothetical protein
MVSAVASQVARYEDDQLSDRTLSKSSILRQMVLTSHVDISVA